MLKESGYTGIVSSAALGISRSSLYYDSRKDDSEVRHEIRRLAFRHKKHGYRMIHHQLRRSGWLINHKKVYRIYREEGLKIRQKWKKKRYKVEKRKLPVPERPDQTWAGDFVHASLTGGRKVRIFVSVDLCTREIPVLYADYSISGEKLKQKLINYSETNPLPEYFIFDNGTEFRSKAIEEWSGSSGVNLHFIQPGKPTQNAFVESLNGKLRNEFLNHNWFYSLNELRESLEEWRKEYNSERLHSSLGYLTPLEFRNKLNLDQEKTNI